MRQCERCGKWFDETKLSKYSTGRFCSKSCANTRIHSEETKAKIKQGVLNAFKHGYSKTYKRNIITTDRRIESYKKRKNILIPYFCPVCGKDMSFYATKPTIKPKRKTCSKDCRIKYLSQLASNQKNHGAGHKGIYKGFRCDSSLELAYLIYHLDHRIPIKRCDKTFKYIFEGKEHTYVPDFIVNDTIVEIKGWDTKSAKIKLQAAKDEGYNAKILYRKDIEKEIQYVCKQYSVLEKDIWCLYEPSVYKKICPICGKEYHTRRKEQIACCSRCASTYTSRYYIWISNGNELKHVHPDDLDGYLSKGWFRIKQVGKKGGWSYIKI